MRAILDRIIVKRSLAEAKVGRIVLALQNQPDKGTVIAIGPGKRDSNGNLHPVPVQVGEIVYFDKTSGQELEEGGERYVVLDPNVIIGVAEPESEAASHFQDAVRKLCA